MVSTGSSRASASPKDFSIALAINGDESSGSSVTYRFSGRDMRLTDVHGDVITEILSAMSQMAGDAITA